MKKFIIAMLCVAVLFGFAACDNSTGTGSSSNVELRETGIVTAKAGVEYLIGEEVDPADFVFTAYGVDGSEVAVDGVGAKLTSNTTDAANEEATVSFSWNGITFNGEVAVYNPDSIELTEGSVKTDYFATDWTGTTKYTDDLLDLEGLTITATYTDKDDNEKTRTISVDNPKVSATIEDWATAGDTEVKVTYGSAPAKTYDVTLAVNRVSSLKVTMADETKKFYVGGTAPVAADFTVKAVMSNGEEEALSPNKTTGDTNYVFVTAAGDAAAPAVSMEKASKVTITVKYNGNNVAPNSTVANATIDVQVLENKVTGIKIDGNGASESTPIEVKVGQKASETNGYGLTVKEQTADGNLASTALSFANEEFTVSIAEFDEETYEDLVGKIVTMTVTADAGTATAYVKIATANTGIGG